MATQERAYTVDDVWRLEHQPLKPTDKYYLIDGELMIKMAPTELHGERRHPPSERSPFPVRRSSATLAVSQMKSASIRQATGAQCSLPDVAFDEQMPRDGAASRGLEHMCPTCPIWRLRLSRPRRRLPKSGAKPKSTCVMARRCSGW